MKFLTALLLVTVFILSRQTVDAQKKLSIVGSSTSACFGPTVADSCYVGRLRAYFNKQLPNDTIISNEFAVGGYTVYQGMPSWYVSPYANPALQPDPGHNITAALASHPDVILINYPTNGYEYLTVNEILFCLRTIRNEATLAGVPCFVSSTQPRTSGVFGTPAVKAKLALLKDSILATFGNFAIDFYTGLINPADSSIRYDAGDGTHMNNTGHDSLFQRVLRKNIFGNAPAIPITPACTVNLAPANGSVTTQSTTATLSWNAAADASSYDVYFWTTNTTSTTPIANTTATSFTVNGLSPSTLYKWFIVPRNAAGAASNCGAVNTFSFTTAAITVPLPNCVTNTSPSNGSVVGTQATATLIWNVAAGANSYDVYIWTGNTAPATPVANVAGTSYTASGLSSATSYSWYVAPRNQTGSATGCLTNNTFSFTTAAVPVPLPNCVSNISPSNGSTLGTQTTATLNWNVAANANAYDVYIWTGNTAPATPVASVTGNSYAVNSLVAATTYRWYVVPRNQTGNAANCAAANTFSFTTAAIPVPLPNCVSNVVPANGSTLATQTTVSLSWDASATASSYDIYFWTANTSSTTPIGSTTFTSFSVNGLTPATLYSWYIVPRNVSGAATGCGMSGNSFTTAALPPPVPAPLPPACVINNTPANGAFINTQTTATLNWNAVTGAASYNIYIWSGNTIPAQPAANVTATSFNATNLSPASAYTWYIVPVNAAGSSIGCDNPNKFVFNTAAAPVTGNGTGLLGTYYNGTTLSGFPLLTRVDAEVNLACTYATVLSPAVGIVPAEHYSVRWTGQIAAAYTETYTFYTLADDGIRLWVNGQLLIANWVNQGSSEKSATLAMLAGQKYDIVIEYYQNTGESIAKLSWSSASTAKSIVPQKQLYPAANNIPVPPCSSNINPADGASVSTETTASLTWSAVATATSYDVYIWTGASAPAQPVANVTGTAFTATGLTAGATYSWYIAPKNAAGFASNCGSTSKTSFTTAPAIAAGTGLLANYYNGTGLAGAPLLTRIDPVIDFSFTYTTVLSPAPGVVPQDYYSVRWSGQVLPKYTETYTFYTVSDDGIRLWVNGSLLIDNWNNQSATEKSGTITLTAGRKYDIVVEYFENTGVSVTRLLWSSPSTPKSVIPQSQLYPAPGASSTSMLALARLSSVGIGMLPAYVNASVIPNPVKAGQPARLKISSDARCGANIYLLNSSGAFISTQKINLRTGMNTAYIKTVPAVPGMYIICITGDFKTSNIQLLVQ